MSFDNDSLNYFPIKDGIPPSSAAMAKFSKLPEKHRKIFQFDEHFSTYHNNKISCLNERYSKYVQGDMFTTNVDVGKTITQYIVEKLTTESPDRFFLYIDRDSEEKILYCKPTGDILIFHAWWHLKKYYPRHEMPEGLKLDALGALGMQVPEDFVVCKINKPHLDEDSSRALYINLMAPNGWKAEWAIGRSFGEIHEHVLKANGSPVIKFPAKVLQMILKMKEPVQRVGAISFRSHTTLNRHPDAGIENKWNWTDLDNQMAVLRFERQTVTPFPELGCFLFTIRTYFNDLKDGKRLYPVLESLKEVNIHKDNYQREFLTKHGKDLRDYLIKFKDSNILFWNESEA